MALLLIFLIKDLKPKSGIYFGQEKNSILMAWKSYYVVGPACMGFLLIDLLGWSFKDWYGSATLAIIFSIVLYFLPTIIRSLETQNETEKKNLKILMLFVFLSIITVVVSIYSPNGKTILSKFLYFFFIIAVGEELLFRGYLQSSFNLFFAKKFKVGQVEFGWGLILTALLFGLMHSLFTHPIAWPWMLFTFVGGLILGFVTDAISTI